MSIITNKKVQDLLKQYPDDLPVIGFCYGMYADDIQISAIKVIIEKDTIEPFMDNVDLKEDATEVLAIDFKSL